MSKLLLFSWEQSHVVIVCTADMELWQTQETVGGAH